MSKKKKQPSSSWSQVDNIYYRVLKRYETDQGWKIGIKDWVRISPEGGGIIIASMTTRGMRMTILNCGGHLVSEWIWREHEPPVPMILLAWLSDNIITIGQDGCLIIHTLIGEDHSRVPLTHRSQAAGQPVINSFFDSNNVSVVTKDFLITLSIPDLRFSKYTSVTTTPSVIPLRDEIGCGSDVDFFISNSILICKNGFVYNINQSSCKEITNIGTLQCVHGCVSEDYIAIVLTSQSTSDFTALRVLDKRNSDIIMDLPLSGKPASISWCGEHIIMTVSDVGTHEHTVFGVSIHNSTTTVLSNYRSEHCLVSLHHSNTSSCGISIVHDQGYDVLESVGSEILKIISPKSESVGAKLYKAQILHSKGMHPPALKLVRSLVHERSLYRAINQCLIAALHDSDVVQQKVFLQSAALGRTYCPEHDAGVFGSTCADVRLLNSIRSEPVYIDITYNTYASEEFKKHKGILQSLISRKLYPLAVSICEYSGIPSNEVVKSWAIQQVHSGAADEAIMEIISVQVAQFPGLSVKPIFEAAIRKSKFKLALLLLDLEPLLSERVKQTLALGEPVRALKIATDANDSDLASSCLLKCRKDLEKSEFYHILRGNSETLRLYQTYCEQRDVTGLMDLFSEMGSVHHAGLWCLRTALYDRRTTLDIRARTKELTKAKNFFAKNGKSSDLENRLLGDQLKLEERQQELRNAGVPVGPHCGLADTIKLLIVDKKYKEADSLAKMMGMTDGNYWFIKLRTLCAQLRFSELEKWVAGDNWKKALTHKLSTPISFKHFVNECLKAGDPKEASKYIPRINDYAMKAEAYCDCGMIEEAVKVSHNNNDPDILLAVRSRVDKEDAEQLKKIDEIHASMTGGT